MKKICKSNSNISQLAVGMKVMDKVRDLFVSQEPYRLLTRGPWARQHFRIEEVASERHGRTSGSFAFCSKALGHPVCEGVWESEGIAGPDTSPALDLDLLCGQTPLLNPDSNLGDTMTQPAWRRDPPSGEEPTENDSGSVSGLLHRLRALEFY